ncbi:hypothetical protein V1512DRAFT_261856 [Lipomyces arxii]|uniref:uncharacterized protein n=1 Tax=Lipomyces arxii TaxID=56418 RepID=UPI0034CDC170
MVGLSGPKNKLKIASDPRNTNWANDTERFGHRHLHNLGWKPGTGLGSSAAEYSITSHVKIQVKDDTLGLGANLAKAKQDADNWAPGLDSFQELLSRLNGSGTEPEEGERKSMWEVETKVSQTYNRLGKWGNRVQFVQGEKLGATIEDDVLEISRKNVKTVLLDKAMIQSEIDVSASKRRKHRHYHRHKMSEDEEEKVEETEVHETRKSKHKHRTKEEREEHEKKRLEKKARRAKRELKRQAKAEKKQSKFDKESKKHKK